jgi:catechol 2,3-dioxygenase-like lactoylglutathione lyase family enzyme
MRTRSFRSRTFLVVGAALFLAGVTVGQQVSTAAAVPGGGYTKLNHVAFYAANSPEAVEFYTKTMGFRVAFTNPEADGRPQAVIFQISRETFLELLQSSSTQPPGFAHVGLEVEDINSAVARLKESNVRVDGLRVSRSKATNTIVEALGGVRLELAEFGPESLTRKSIESWR